MKTTNTSDARAAVLRVPFASALPMGEALVLMVILFIVLSSI
jgi:hypothetical protein